MNLVKARLKKADSLNPRKDKKSSQDDNEQNGA